MVVGMTTVFAILLLVIYLGKGLIVLVNKYAPEEVITKKTAPATVAITNQDTAAIVSTVSMITGGKGKVTKIEKL